MNPHQIARSEGSKVKVFTPGAVGWYHYQLSTFPSMVFIIAFLDFYAQENLQLVSFSLFENIL